MKKEFIRVLAAMPCLFSFSGSIPLVALGFLYTVCLVAYLSRNGRAKRLLDEIEEFEDSVLKGR